MAINDDLGSLQTNTKVFLENNALLIHGADGPSANHTSCRRRAKSDGNPPSAVSEIFRGTSAIRSRCR